MTEWDKLWEEQPTITTSIDGFHEVNPDFLVWALNVKAKGDRLKDKLEAVNTHMKSAPDRVPRDNWLRPTKSFLLQVLDWIIAHRKILEEEK